MVDYPACFDSEKQFKEWGSMAVKSGLSKPFLSFCVDCSYHYKREMEQQRRCERPDTEFIATVTEDGEVEDVGTNGK